MNEWATKAESEASREAVLQMWVIYQHPLDYPDSFVLRRWIITDAGAKPTMDVQVASSLVAIRSHVPMHCYRIDRYTDDEPHIVEVWM